MNTNTTDTTTVTASQPTHANEGSCESVCAKLRELAVQRGKWMVKLHAERSAARRALAAEQAAHALDLDTFKSGSHEMALQVKHLRERTLMAEAVRDSALARVSELVDAVKAERVAHAAYDEDGGDELLFTWANARQLTDMLVSKHEGAGAEAITKEALLRESGWTQHEHLLNMVERRDGPIYVTVRFRKDSTEVCMGTYDAPNCHTMHDLRTLMRLFTAPDAARARDEVKDEGESITTEKLERVGWEKVDVDKTAYSLTITRDGCEYHFTRYNDGRVAVGDCDGYAILARNCHNVNALQQLVHLIAGSVE